ncbi:YciK family oxidoreductase [Ectothiorhodospiraceae bacterium 2226]|nr:YciK family oxidoreductase [Ectothiorhodospiraceae bacterium 2226]
MTVIPKDYRPAPDLLKDRVILITGAGDGIGAAAARACAAHGATVILLGRTTRKLEAVYDSIEQAGHPEPAIYPMNLEGAVAKDFADLALKIDEEFGRLDGLLHNAANLGTLTPIEHYDPELWAKVLQVNVNAPYLLTRACLKLLKQAPDARVLFTGAEVGRHGRAYWGAYAASHAAAENIMETLADEVESLGRIRVNSIDPGAVRTAMRTRAFPAEDASVLPPPADIMRPYLYLLGPDSRDVHGQRLRAQD